MTVLAQFVIYGGLPLVADRGRGSLAGRPAATIFAGRAMGVVFTLAAALAVWHGSTSS